METSSTRPVEGYGVTHAAARVVASTSLFRGAREIVISHRGQEYRLRITKADKLILTK